MEKLLTRLKEPTPSFFKKLRNIGLALTAIATVIITAPVAIPAGIVTIAGYVAVAGGVVSAVSQLTTTNDEQ